MKSIYHACLVVLMTAFLASQSGCLMLSSLLGQKRKPTLDTTMLASQGYRIPPGGMASPLPDHIRLTGNECVLEIRSSEKQMAAIPLDAQRSMTVEELTAQAELPDKLGRAHLYIIRPTNGASPIQLQSVLDGKGKCVNPGHNYALRQGDHVIAIGDGRSLFERFLDDRLGRD